jgi:hypothetical protein
MLTQAQTELWNAYLQAAARAPRAEKLRALDLFLDSLAGASPNDLFSWATDLAKRVVDQEDSLLLTGRRVILGPLMERVLLPVLLEGYQKGMPGYARWLAGLSRTILWDRTYREQLPEGERTESGLLKAALRKDSADYRARMRLIQLQADRLRYTLHELPTGVLYGIDGATPEQCQELEEELREFRDLLIETGDAEKYAELIDLCDFHYRKYRAYLLSIWRGSGYAEYLQNTRGQQDEAE